MNVPVSVVAIYQELEKADELAKRLAAAEPENEDYAKLSQGIKEVATFAFALGNSKECCG